MNRLDNALSHDEVATTLTPRQLEVAMLLRSGLRQTEIAQLLGISQRQVARLAGQARERSCARNSSHLMAMLAQRAPSPALSVAA
jgi:DNA-binding CsgD family transcriptional regulator